MKTINFIFSTYAIRPSGGHKVVYQYANRLAKDGYKVNIIYPHFCLWRKDSWYRKSLRFYELLLICIYRIAKCKWYELNKSIDEHFTPSLSYSIIPKADIYIATTPKTAIYLNNYPIHTDNKYYFIQNYDKWGFATDDILRETYRYKLHKIVISKWLKRILEQENQTCSLVPNGFDNERFTLTTPIENKDKFSVSMLFSKNIEKGSSFGFAVLDIIKKKYPQLRVNIFSTYRSPKNLPTWCNYYRNPDRDTHNRINNESAIYLGTSHSEGWGLPIGEAMICGQAVVCTNNCGYLEMATDNETALVSPIKDVQAFANNIIRLIEEEDLRYRIAHAGNLHIQKMSAENSYSKFKEALCL